MGAGKTQVGQIMARRLGRTFTDLDVLIAERCDMSIPDIFERHGEFAFRACEAQMLRDIPSRYPKAVVAVGGGAPMHFDSMDFMLKNGIVIYLDASAKTLVARLTPERDSRPLLHRSDWVDFVQALLHERSPVYQRAHLRVKTDEYSIEEACQLAMDAAASMAPA